MRSLPRRRGQASHQKASGIGREAFHRPHRLRVARIDMSERERHRRLLDPVRFPRREGGAGFAASGEEPVPVLRHADHERDRAGLAVVLLARCDHAVPGRRDPVRHPGALAQGGGHLIEMRSERLRGVEDSEPTLGAGKAGPEGRRRRCASPGRGRAPTRTARRGESRCDQCSNRWVSASFLHGARSGPALAALPASFTGILHMPCPPGTY